MDALFWFLISNIIEIIIACVVITVVWMFYIGFCQVRLNKLVDSISDFTVSYKLVGDDGKTAIALDDRSKRICLFTNGRLQPSSRIVPYKDLVGVELTKLGETVTSTSTASQLGRGAVGGLAFGGLGALAGGLSGKQKHTNITKRISLLLTFNDVDNPYLSVVVSDASFKTGGLFDDSCMKKANEWLGRLQVIVKNNEKN